MVGNNKRSSLGIWAWKGLLIDQFLGAPAMDSSSCGPVNWDWFVAGNLAAATNYQISNMMESPPPKRLQEAPINVWCINLNPIHCTSIHWKNHHLQRWIADDGDVCDGMDVHMRRLKTIMSKHTSALQTTKNQDDISSSCNTSTNSDIGN